MTAPRGEAASRATNGPLNRPIIELRDVIRVYREADVETIALRGVDLEIQAGEFVAIMGRSGSGKSTLLQLLAGSDRPTAGRVMVAGVDLSRADDTERASLRGARVGMVFQSQNLVSFLDLNENIELAATLAGRSLQRAQVHDILDRVGLANRARHRPDQLSGGEQQRAALALVLASRPSIILADEITGELDTITARLVLDLLAEVHRLDRVTIVVATHDPAVALRADRTVILRDGVVVSDRERSA
ncbi:MAG: ABC transporter ATP-binding protein [Chloroflexota bacterium]